MWVKLEEKHKNGSTWLARNEYEKSTFTVAYQTVDEENHIALFVLKDRPHIYVLVDEVWEDN